jgi:hypothetical protein
MQSRQQSRRRAILPIKIHLDASSGKRTLLAHTTDISRSGCRVVGVEMLPQDAIVVIEYKHNRADFKVNWCKTASGLKYQVSMGLKKIKPDPRFWGEELSHGKEEMGNYTSYRRPQEKHTPAQHRP